MVTPVEEGESRAAYKTGRRGFIWYPAGLRRDVTEQNSAHVRAASTLCVGQLLLLIKDANVGLVLK